MPDIADAFYEDPEGTIIAIEVTAGAKKAAFPYGYNEWRKVVGCRVTAPALEGKANRAIQNLVAESLGIPVSSVSIRSGALSSQKKVLVSGLGKSEVLDRILRLFSRREF